ncbi:MAG: ABC transporter permease subunit [Deltaproteobacteria bacterium]|nr:ABC transporter permease subunit [Deltaproteobacteria bacterium]MBI3079092.1 ABC transporter permease subunit [Deltaproteobacteria bacterium]
MSTAAVTLPPARALPRPRLPGGLLSLLVLAAAWEAAGHLLGSLLLPPLSQVAAAWVRLLQSGQLLASLAVSLGTLLAGFTLALALGLAVGLLMGRFRRVEQFLDLYIDALMAAPSVAFIPVLVLWLGLGVASRIAVVFLFAFFVIVVNTRTGVRQVDPTLVEMARSFGARGRELFLKVELPASLPMIMAGVRLGMGRAVKGMINAEVLLALAGLGALIMQYGSAFATDALYAIIFTVLTVALLATEVIHWLDHRLSRWKVEVGLE